MSARQEDRARSSFQRSIRDLETNRERTLSDLFKERANLLAYTEDLVDEVDVVDASREEGVDLGEDTCEVTLAVLVAEECFVAEGAGVGATAGELDFGAVMKVIRAVAGEDVVQVMVSLDRVVGVVEWTERAHIGCAKTGCAVEEALLVAPAASGNHLPRVCGELWQGLIRFAAEDDIGFRFVECSDGGYRSMRANNDRF